MSQNRYRGRFRERAVPREISTGESHSEQPSQGGRLRCQAPRAAVRLTAMKRFFPCLLFLLAVGGPVAFAQTPDDQYLRIYTLIQSADALENSGQPGNARAGYQEALAALQGFQKIYPEWNPKVVTYRLNYLAAKIGAPATT